jgi:hypothetical protein
VATVASMLYASGIGIEFPSSFALARSLGGKAYVSGKPMRRASCLVEYHLAACVFGASLGLSWKKLGGSVCRSRRGTGAKNPCHGGL